MEMKVGLTFAFMNLKKLAKIKVKWGLLEEEGAVTRSILHNSVNKRKMAGDLNGSGMQIPEPLCLQSEEGKQCWPS